MRFWSVGVAWVGVVALGAGAVFGEVPAPVKYEIKRDIVYARPSDRELLLDAYLPKEAEKVPAVLVVHGGSWKSGNKSQLAGYAMRLAARGMAAFAINYRLAPEYKHPCQIDDCRAALQWIQEHAAEHGVDGNRIGAIGYSAGAHLVFLLGVAGDQQTPTDPVAPAKEGRLKAVVAGGSPCDFTVVKEKSKTLVDFLGGTQSEKPEVYVNASPRFYISPDDPPILFFHGTGDELVTIKGPEIMVEEFRAKGVEAELVRIDRADHITAAMNREAVEQAIHFLDTHLIGKRPSAPQQ